MLRRIMHVFAIMGLLAMAAKLATGATHPSPEPSSSCSRPQIASTPS
jgi:hypothetical protein